jgi:hypothetical protein
MCIKLLNRLYWITFLVIDIYIHIENVGFCLAQCLQYSLQDFRGSVFVTGLNVKYIYQLILQRTCYTYSVLWKGIYADRLTAHLPVPFPLLIHKSFLKNIILFFILHVIMIKHLHVAIFWRACCLKDRSWTMHEKVPLNYKMIKDCSVC